MATYYVAKTGNDGNVGSFASPWLTIQYGINQLVTGDTLYVRVGTYNEAVEIHDLYGDAGHITTISNYSNETVIIDAVGLTPSVAIVYFNRCSWMDIVGLEIKNGTTCSGIGHFYGDPVSHMTFKNLNIHDIPYHGFLWGSGTPGVASNLVMDNCTITNTNLAASGSEECQLVNVNGFEIKNCTISLKNASDGLNIVSSSNGTIHNNDLEHLYIDAAGVDITNIDVYGNYYHSGASSTGTFSDVGCENTPASVTDINFFNNIYYRTVPSTDSATLVVGGEAGGFTALNFTFINNTIYTSAGSGWTDVIFGDATGNYSGCVVSNNILVMSSTSCLGMKWKYWANGGVTITNNLLYCLSGALYSESKATDWITWGANSVLANPLLVNPPSNFSLTSNSPAINAGSATSAPGTDYIGNARTTIPSIGAYEQLAIPNAPTSLSIISGNGQVSLSWTPASGGTGITVYTQIQYSIAGYPTSYLAGTTGIVWTTGSGGTIQGLTNGVLYYFAAFTKVVDGSLVQYSLASVG